MTIEDAFKNLVAAARELPANAKVHEELTKSALVLKQFIEEHQPKADPDGKDNK